MDKILRSQEMQIFLQQLRELQISEKNKNKISFEIVFYP